MKKFSLVSVIILMALIVVIVVVLFNLGPFAAKAINLYGPRLTKTEVHVSTADISLLSGTATLSDFILGSPKGFTSPETVRVRSIYLVLDEKSLLSDTVVIDRIEVFRSEIFYEKRDGTDNLKAILDAMKSGEKKAEPSSARKAPGKRLLIRDLILREGTVNVLVSGTGGKNVQVKLSEVHLRNVSEKTAGGVTTEIFAAVLDAIYKQVASPGLVGTLDRDLKTIGAKAKSAVENMKEMLGN